MAARRPKVVSLIAFFALVGCGGDGPTTPPGGGGGGGGGGAARTIKESPSFSQDVFEIFTRRGCTASGCHGTGEGGLTMTSASVAFGNLVNRPSAGNGQILVVPGNADGSYLVRKLEGATGIVGAQMPLGGSPLDNIDLTNIKNWINRGANNN